MSYHWWHVPIWYSIQSNISPNKLRVVKIGAAGSCSLKLRICLQPLLAFLIIIMLIPLQCEEERHSVKAAAATTSSCRWWCTSTTTTTATIIPLSSSRLCVPSIFCSISIYTPLLVYLPPHRQNHIWCAELSWEPLNLVGVAVHFDISELHRFLLFKDATYHQL